MTTDPSLSSTEARGHLERCSNKFDRLLQIQHRGLDAYATFATAVLQDAKHGEFAPKKLVRAWCELSEVWIKNGFALLDVFMPPSEPAAPTSPSAAGKADPAGSAAPAPNSTDVVQAATEQPSKRASRKRPKPKRAK